MYVAKHGEAPDGSPIHPKNVAPCRPSDFVLEVGEGEGNRLDPYCAASDVKIHEDGSVAMGAGAVLALKGYSEGRHYWEFTAKVCGWYSFCGVCTKHPCDEEEIRRGYTLAEAEGAFCFAGCDPQVANHGRDPEPMSAFHAGREYNRNSIPPFLPGERVGVLLDCDKGSLSLFRNGNCVAANCFVGWLRHQDFYPAFGASGLQTEFTDIAFDLPVPEV